MPQEIKKFVQSLEEEDGRPSLRREKLQALVQKAAMKHYGWDEKIFIAIFGRNYL